MNANHVKVLLMDDSPEDLTIIERLLTQFERAQFTVLATNSQNNCLELLQTARPDLLLLDYTMPTEDGLSFLHRAAAMVDLPPVIMLTGHQDLHLFAHAIRSGASDCLSKHAMTSQSLGQAAVQALAKHHHQQELSRFDKNVIFAFIESSGLLPTMGGERLAELTVELGAKLGANQYQLELLRLGALLHDIGKLGVSRQIIDKPGPLTRDEREEIQLHPLIGERMCAHLNLSTELMSIIRNHHERWDGDGYVDGLAGVEIPFLTRIVSVADCFDAMTTDRPYRTALAHREATKRLAQGAGRQWDPAIIDTFLSRVRLTVRQVASSSERYRDAA